MDRALKERVVGATVLVVIAVLVVPVFLDGPTEAPATVSERVILPGQGEQDTRRQTIVLDRDRDQPVPAGGAEARTDTAADAHKTAVVKPDAAPESRQSAEPPPQVADEQVAAKKAATTEDAPPESRPPDTGKDAPPAAPKADSTTGMWAVQLGSFSDEANAERLAADLRKKGYAAFLSRVQADSRVLHRVRVGPQRDRASAEKVAAQLGNDGLKGQVVPHP